MARIGDYIDAGLNSYDPSPLLRANANATATIGNAMSQGIGAIGDAMEKVKKDKEDYKIGKNLANAMKLVAPEMADGLESYVAAMDSEDSNSQKGELGRQIASFINMGLEQKRSDAMLGLQVKQLGLDERRVGIDERRNEVDVQRITNAMQQEQADATTKAELTQFMARPLLDQALSATAQASKAGQRPLIDTEALKRAYNKSPEQQYQIASAALAGLPKQDPVELRNVKFTRDGQAMEGTGYFDPKSGAMRLLPVDDGSGGQSIDNASGVFRAPSTNYSLGKDAGGPDEMQDYWTNRGYSSTGKNLAPGVVAVNPKTYKHGTVFQDANSGEVFIAADSHGNRDPNVIDVFQPPGEYQRSNKPRNMRVIGFEENVGKNPQEIAQQRAKWSQAAAQSGIQAGAPTTAAKTPEEKRLLELQIAEKETAAKGQAIEAEAKGREANAKQSNSQRVLGVISKYKNPDGSPTAALKDAVGFGEGVGSWTSYMTGGNLGNSPETVANQRELQLDLLETDLLNAAKDLKPVSEDEMKMLLSRRPKTTDSPEVWARYIARAEQIIRNGMGDTTAAAPSAKDDAYYNNALSR